MPYSEETKYATVFGGGVHTPGPSAPRSPLQWKRKHHVLMLGNRWVEETGQARQ